MANTHFRINFTYKHLYLEFLHIFFLFSVTFFEQMYPIEILKLQNKQFNDFVLELRFFFKRIYIHMYIYYIHLTREWINIQPPYLKLVLIFLVSKSKFSSQDHNTHTHTYIKGYPETDTGHIFINMTHSSDDVKRIKQRSKRTEDV